MTTRCDSKPPSPPPTPAREAEASGRRDGADEHIGLRGTARSRSQVVRPRKLLRRFGAGKKGTVDGSRLKSRLRSRSESSRARLLSSNPTSPRFATRLDRPHTRFDRLGLQLVDREIGLRGVERVIRQSRAACSPPVSNVARSPFRTLTGSPDAKHSVQTLSDHLRQIGRAHV